MLGLQTGRIFAGAVVIETPFRVPVMGQLMVQAIFQQDVMVVQGSVLVMASAMSVGRRRRGSSRADAKSCTPRTRNDRTVVVTVDVATPGCYGSPLRRPGKCVRRWR